MTLDELKAHLNLLRTDPAWKAAWIERGYDVGKVIRYLRWMVAQAAKWTQDDEEESWQHFRAWVKHIVAYAAGERLEPGDHHAPVEYGRRPDRRTWQEPRQEPRQEFDGDPEYEGDEGRQAWVRFFVGCNQQWTFKQATAWFRRLNGYSPKWTWPGMPKTYFHMSRRIKDVGPELLHPGLPTVETGPIPD